MDLVTDPPLHLNRVDPALNMARFYRIALAPTLFGEVVLSRAWGRIGTRGRVMTETFEEMEKAEAAWGKLERAKRRRGYCQDGG